MKKTYKKLLDSLKPFEGMHLEIPMSWWQLPPVAEAMRDGAASGVARCAGWFLITWGGGWIGDGECFEKQIQGGGLEITSENDKTTLAYW